MNFKSLFETNSSHAKTALIMAPHTDDGEFGCGGTISKLIEANWKVLYLAFSAAEDSVPQEWPRDILRKEAMLATKHLGIPEENCIIKEFPVRRFSQFRQEILDLMIEIGRLHNPALVFLPSTCDTHQDHGVISAEGFRAFKKHLF